MVRGYQGQCGTGNLDPHHIDFRTDEYVIYPPYGITPKKGTLRAVVMQNNLGITKVSA